MKIDLRKGFGDFEEYNLFKFPDNSIKFEQKSKILKEDIIIDIALKTNEDILTLLLILDFYSWVSGIRVNIKYMMYQQDDRRFSTTESFGLKFICNLLNQYPNVMYTIFHPHSDKVEFINNLKIIPNTHFVNAAIADIGNKDALWVIPDSGAFKTQFKQTLEVDREFLTCMKSRDHKTGELTTIVETDDLKGRDCFIVDDICLGGRTFMAIAKELKKKGAGKLYLIISHGLFNYGIEGLLEHFEKIYTTDSICELSRTERLIKYNI